MYAHASQVSSPAANTGGKREFESGSRKTVKLSRPRRIHAIAAPLLLTAVGLLGVYGTVAYAAPPFPSNMCAADRNGSSLSCNSNDVKIASVAATDPDTGQPITTCTAGQPVKMSLSLGLQSSATRYDVGVFVALDGKDPQTLASAGGSANCAVADVPTSPAPFSDQNSNTCGDVINSAATGTVNVGTITLTCQPDSNGNLQIQGVVTWDTNAGFNSGCQNADWVYGNTTSKCNGSILANIPVTVHGGLTIKKVTNPASDTTTQFGFTASGASAAPASFNLVGGGQQVITTGALSSTAQQVVVTEAAVGSWQNSSITCVDSSGNPNPGFVTVDVANRKITANLTIANSSATCTFTNSQQSAVTVTKQVTGATAGYAAASTFPITVNCGAGFTQTLNLANGASGTLSNVPGGASCTVSEGTLPATTQPANFQYGTPTITPSSFTTTAGGTQNVSVTNPITRLTSSIQLTKTVSGAPAGGVSGTFGFSANCGSDGTFAGSVVLSGATSGTGTISPVPAGAVCAVSEVSNPSAPANYTWSSLAAPVTGLAVNAPGPVSAAFTNVLTRQTGSLTLTKQVTDSVSGAAAALVTGSFGFTVSCDTGALPSQSISVTAGDTSSVTINNVPAGAVCSIAETTKPTTPTGYSWDAPAYANNGATIPANGTATIITTNHLSAVAPGSIAVTKAVVGGPAPVGTFSITVACPQVGAVAAYGPVTQQVAAGATTTFNSIPAPNPSCTVTEDQNAANLPAPPANYAWDTSAPTPPAPLTNVATGSTVTVTNTLKRLTSSIQLAKNISGGPVSGVTGAFDFSANCASDGTFTGSVTLTAATSGTGTISGIPAGAVCTVSEVANPSAPANYSWSNLAAPVTGLVVNAPGPASASFTNTLTRENSTITVTKTVTNGPGGVSYGSFNFTANCATDGTFGGNISLTAGATNGNTNITVPAGATCAVSEGSPPAPPTNYTWDTAPAAVNVTTSATAPVTAAFTNNLIRQTSSIAVTKTVTGNPTYTSFGTFKFDIACDAGSFSNPVASITLSGGATTGGATISNVPAGANCTVTEETPLTAAPANYAWQSTASPVVLTTTPTGPNNAAFTNVLARQKGSLTLTKVIAGPAAGTQAANGDFIFNVDCGADGSYASQVVTITGGQSASTVISNVPAGASCSVTETGTPAAPVGYTWNTTVGYSGSPIQIAPNSNVTETVTNTLDAVPVGSITVTKAIVGGPVPAAGFSITVACPASGQDPAYNTTQTVAGGTSSVFSNIPVLNGNTCTVTENTPLPSPPTNYSWDASTTPPSPQSVVLSQPSNGSGGTGSVTVTNTLIRQSSAIPLQKMVSGGPAGGITAAFDFAADCGADGQFSASINLAAATSGAGSITGVPAGATCIVSENAPPPPPANYSWGALPSSVSVTTGATTPTASFTNMLTRQSSSIAINKQVSGGPATGVTATFNFAADCSASGDGIFNAAIALTGATSGTTSISPVPAGAVCTVSEATPPSPPAGYVWGATPAPVTITTTQAGPNNANFINSLVVHTGTLKIVQVVGGPAALISHVNGPFTYAVDCGSGNGATGTQTIVISGGASNSISLPAIAADTSCAVTELTTAPAPTGSTWGPPSYFTTTSSSAAAGPVALPATARVNAATVVGATVIIPANGTAIVTVSNTLAAAEGPQAIVIPAPLSRIWLLLFSGFGLLLTGIYFQRYGRK